jgi:hypothetical protein
MSESDFQCLASSLGNSGELDWSPAYGLQFRRQIMMVSDGIDRFGGGGPSDPYVDSAIDEAQRAGVIIYSIYTPGVGHYAHSFWRMNCGQNYLPPLLAM